MALEDTIRNMLTEKADSKADSAKINKQIASLQTKLKTAAGDEAKKLKDKIKLLRKQLKESYEEVSEAEGDGSGDYVADGKRILDSNGDEIHVANSEEEAAAIVAKLNSDEEESLKEAEDKEEEGEEEDTEEKPAEEGEADGEAFDFDFEDEVPEGEGEGTEGEEGAGEEGETEGEGEGTEGEEGEDIPEEDRVTVVVVSPDHETEEEGEENEDEKEAKSPEIKPQQNNESVIEKLLTGETLSEDFKERTRVIFETALNEKLDAHKQLVESQIKQKYSKKLKTIKEQYDQRLTEEISGLEDKLVERIDSFLNFEVDQWVQENRVALVSNMRAELTEEFIDGLKGLFKEHYIDVPEEKFDLIGAQEETIQQLETKLEESVAGYSKVAKENKELKRKIIFAEAASGLTETQKIRFEKLTEKVDFDGEKNFANKIQIIKESYFGKKQEEQVKDEPKKVVSESRQESIVDIYARLIK